MERLNRKRKEPSTLSEEGGEDDEEEGPVPAEEEEHEEVWGVVEWVDTLTEVASKAKEAYEKNKLYLKQLS
jgi:hypothetical protein